jgi:hypothetical protein
MNSIKKLGLGLGAGMVVLLGIAANATKPTESNPAAAKAPQIDSPKVNLMPLEQQPKVEVAPQEPTWHCKDTTSYNHNDDDDNYCVSSDGEGKYVPDWQACQLDPTYHPSQRGARRYNNDCNR